jgi:hypothetical protein
VSFQSLSAASALLALGLLPLVGCTADNPDFHRGRVEAGTGAGGVGGTGAQAGSAPGGAGGGAGQAGAAAGGAGGGAGQAGAAPAGAGGGGGGGAGQAGSGGDAPAVDEASSAPEAAGGSEAGAVDVATGSDVAPPDVAVPADAAAGMDVAVAPDAPVPDVAAADLPAADLASALTNGLRAEYFAGMDFQTPLFQSTDSQINFNWMHGSPDPRVPVDAFSVRWTGRIQPRHSELYTLSIVSDDGARLAINGQYVIDKWVSQSSVENVVQIQLEAGRLYDLKVEYFDRVLTALVRFYWTSASQPKEIVPYSRLFTP